MGNVGEWVANLPWWAIVGVVIVLGLIWLWLRRVKDDRKLIGFKAKSIRETVESLIIAIVLVFGIVRPFLIQTFYIPSESMMPTLLVGDRLIASKLAYRFHEPKRGDVIVFRAPADADVEGHRERDLVKRIIGLPGDIIEIREGHLYLNGKRQFEKYIAGTDGPTGSRLEDPYALENGFQVYTGFKQLGPDKIQVPPGYFYMMGDNRNNSNDSRGWGALERKRVIGKAWIMFWPPQRIGIIR